MKLKLSLLTIALFNCSAHASNYAPVFTGHWYTHAQFVSQDACYKNSYQYTNLAEGTDSIYVANVLNNLTNHQDCQWGSAFLIAKSNSRPLDFIGTNQQWRTLTTQKTTPTAENWQRNCIHDKAIIDSASTTIWPSFACPNGTHYGVDNGNLACTNVPLVCSADIVGRDLILNGSNKLLGHVGLVSTFSGKNTVVEVLSNPDAVYENTLEIFMKKSKFWGEKHGLVQAPNLTLQQATKIIKDGASSQKKYTLKYTLGWEWNVGAPNVAAKFRCDSFVNFGYLTALLQIFPKGFHFPDTPPLMFNRFLAFRIAQHRDINEPPTILEQVQALTIMPKDNLSYNERLNQVFSDLDLDFAAADEITYRYVYAKYITRAEKMQVLYDLALKHEQEKLHFWYLIDILDILEPIEYTPQLIALYQKQEDLYLKEHLLSNIYDLLTKPLVAGKIIAPEQQGNVLLIKQLFKDILEHETNPFLLKSAITSYQNIGGPEHAKEDINSALLRAKQNHIALNFTPEELLFVKIRLAFATPETQLRDLPELLNTRNSIDSAIMPFDITFTLNKIKSEKINEQLKPLLSDYLLKHQSEILGQNGMLKTSNPDLAYCNWLDAYASVMVKKEADKAAFMFDYIRALSSPILQAQYLRQVDWPVFAKITTRDHDYYRDTFQNKLTDPTLSDDDRQTYQDALSAIKTWVP